MTDETGILAELMSEIGTYDLWNDLSERIGKQGWKLYHIHTIKIVHYCSKSAAQLSYEELEALVANWQKRWT